MKPPTYASGETAQIGDRIGSGDSSAIVLRCRDRSQPFEPDLQIGLAVRDRFIVNGDDCTWMAEACRLRSRGEVPQDKLVSDLAEIRRLLGVPI